MLKQLVSAVLLLSLWDFSDSQTNYCGICPDHTMCKYPNDEPSPECNHVLHAEVSEKDITTILHHHNMIRKRLASGNETSGRPGPLPPSSDMQSMTWDAELAKIARRWALQCTLGADTCRNVDRFNVGQNIYYYKCSDCADNPPDWATAIGAWYKTVSSLSKYSISPYQYSRESGPYTQVVWSRTNKVGCAYVSYKSDRYWVTCVHICNYGPTGNIVGPQTQVYGVGRPCAWCPGLCHDGVFCSFPNN